MDDNMLIEAVRLNPILYDLSHPKYMDSNLKNRVWDNVGQNLYSDGSTCRKRWNNIRDQYRKNLKKTATNVKPAKLYKYHEQLSFLNPYFGDHEESGSGLCPDDVKSNVKNDASFDHFSTTTSPAATQSSFPEPSRASATPSPDTAASQTRDCTLEQAETLSTATATLFEYLLRKNDTERSKHPVDVFLEGISLTLKNLPPYLRNLAKSEIFSIVQKYELRMITDDNQQCQSMLSN